MIQSYLHYILWIFPSRSTNKVYHIRDHAIVHGFGGQYWTPGNKRVVLLESPRHYKWCRHKVIDIPWTPWEGDIPYRGIAERASRPSVNCVRVELATGMVRLYLVDVFILDEYLTPKERKGMVGGEKKALDGAWQERQMKSLNVQSKGINLIPKNCAPNAHWMK
jgi:hypothetical protein